MDPGLCKQQSRPRCPQTGGGKPPLRQLSLARARAFQEVWGGEGWLRQLGEIRIWLLGNSYLRAIVVDSCVALGVALIFGSQVNENFYEGTL